MSAYNDNRRDIKRAYRKKSFQSDKSLVSKSVQNKPAPEHTYSTPSHQETASLRRGIDPHTYVKDVRPAVEHLDFARMLDSARFAWHLVPKGDSANVIARQKYNFASNNLASGSYMDVLVLNVSNVSGSNTVAPTALPAPKPTPALVAEALPVPSVNSGQNPSHPNAGGITNVGQTTAGTLSKGSPGDVYRIQSFGHSEVSQANQTAPNQGGFTDGDPFTYQIWVDGTLFMEWNNFQWSPVTPLQDQWHFSQPLTVTEQIVFRVINTTGFLVNVGEMEICFNGWAEQLSGYVDVAYQQLENN